MSLAAGYNRRFAIVRTTNNIKDEALAGLLAPHIRQIEADIDRWLVEPSCPDELAEALGHSVLGGGKRLRPVLVHLSHEAAGGQPHDELMRRCAVAIELVHCYSLVHDDLPAMDDDVLRRGRPTVHVKFGQAMAVLAGDALLTRAFAVIAQTSPSAGRQDAIGPLIGELAVAAGQVGMIAGQVADMGLCRVGQDIEGLKSIHARKTGALIRASAVLGGRCAAAGADVMSALSHYAQDLGLAFQVLDDVLDATGAAEALGKTPGKDAAAGKLTYVSLLGLDEARRMGEHLTQRACDALIPLGQRGQKLQKLAVLLSRRSH